jgi:hypothetical protein
MANHPGDVVYDNPHHYAMLEMCIPRAEQLATYYSWNKYMVTKCVERTVTRCIDRGIFDSAVVRICKDPATGGAAKR